MITNLVVGNKNATEGVEAPRFYLLDNSTIAVEGGCFVSKTNSTMLKILFAAFHLPKFQVGLLNYLQKIHNRPILMPEPYYSSNVVEKTKDELTSHSDSRGGGISSRF